MFGFLLIPDFALLPYAAALEPLRAANMLSGRQLYGWRTLSPDGQPVAASNGLVIAPDLRLEDAACLDMLMVCAGGNPATFHDVATFQRLRRLARHGVGLGGISGGPYILMRAGLLDGYRFTVHWEHAAALTEEFPEADLRRNLFEIDRDRLTCSGGTAPLDIMHALIAREHGVDLAMQVSEWFLQTQIREGGGPQRMALSERLGITDRAVLRALAIMEERIEQPCANDELARAAGVSPRHLERLFQRHVGHTPGQYYLRLRLDRARLLMRQTDLSVLAVALACGFTSAAHFSRAYRSRFGHPPSSEAARQPARRSAS